MSIFIKKLFCFSVLTFSFLVSFADTCPSALSLTKNGTTIKGVDSSGRLLYNSDGLPLDESVVFSGATIYLDPKREINGELTCVYNNRKTATVIKLTSGRGQDFVVWNGPNWLISLPLGTCNVGSNRPADCLYH